MNITTSALALFNPENVYSWSDSNLTSYRLATMLVYDYVWWPDRPESIMPTFSQSIKHNASISYIGRIANHTVKLNLLLLF